MAHRKEDEIVSTSTKAYWVLSGIAVSTLTGLVLFYLFSWQQHGQFGNFYLRGVTGQQLFDSARTTAMLIGIVGLGGAGFLAYRRQRTSEAVQSTTSKSHQLSEERFRHDTLRSLRERYTIAAEQLGSESFAVRLAGVYALAALADDWAASDELSERQVCIDVLCAYLRTPAPVQPPPTSLRDGRSVPVYVWLRSKKQSRHDPDSRMRDTHEREVRQAVLSVIAAKTVVREGLAGPWSSCRFDFSGATLSRVDFTNCHFSGSLKFARAHFTAETNFDGVVLRTADFSDVTFDKVANFSGACFGWRVEFERTDFFGGAAFQRTEFYMETSFIGAGFGGGSADFRRALFQPNSSTYIRPVFVGASTVLNFSGASFDGEVHIGGEQVRFGRAVLFQSTRPWTVEPIVDWDEATLPSNVYPRSWPPAPSAANDRETDVVDIDEMFPLPPIPPRTTRRIAELLRSITALSPQPPRQP